MMAPEWITVEREMLPRRQRHACAVNRNGKINLNCNTATHALLSLFTEETVVTGL